MRERLFTIPSAFSLLPCTAVCVLWVRSYFYITAVVLLGTESHVYGVSAARGGVYLVRVHGAPEAIPRRVMSVPWREARQDSDVDYQFAGFGYQPPSKGAEAALLPAWSLALALLVLPLAAGSRGIRNARRRRAGRCTACGYDLRATPGRYPECGHEPFPRR